MKIKLTDKTIKSLPLLEKAYEAIDSQIPGFLLMVRPSGTMSFVYSYRNAKGVKKRITFGRYGVLSIAQARLLVKDAAAEVARGNDPQQIKNDTRQEERSAQLNTLGLFIKEYYETWVLRQNKRGDYNLEVLNRDFKFLLSKPLLSITALDVEKWQIAALDKGLKGTTINRRLACLKAVFTRAVDLSHMEYSPLSKVKNVKQLDEERIRYLSEDEESKLLATMRQRNEKMIIDRRSANVWRTQRGYELYPVLSEHQFTDHIEPMVILAMNTGLRRGELFKLTWQDIDMRSNILTVRAANAKSSKVRHVPLNKTVLNVLTIWKEQHEAFSGLVFKNNKGTKFTDIKKAWHNLLEIADIVDFRFHDLRHHFASRLVMNKVSLNTVRDILGHANLATTLRYAHLSDDHRRDAVRSLDR